MGVDNAMAHRHALRDRGDDLYETPEVATEALIAHAAVPGPPGLIWEPACGRGAISKVLRRHGRTVIESDLVDYKQPCALAGVDFLMETRAPAGASTIVTNPPYKLADEFAARAVDLCPRVFMLMRLAFLEGGQRSAARRGALDGGGLARVLVFANRLPMMHRDGWTGRRANSGAAFAWFCWDRAHNGPATVERIWWRADLPQSETPVSSAQKSGGPQAEGA